MEVPREVRNGLKEIAKKKGVSMSGAVNEVLNFSDDPMIAVALACHPNESLRRGLIKERKLEKHSIQVKIENDAQALVTIASRLHGETVAQFLMRCLWAYAHKVEDISKVSSFRLDFAVLYSGEMHSEENHLLVSRFCDSLTKRGISAGVLGTQYRYASGELKSNVTELPKIVLVDRLYDDLKPFILFLERNCKVLNPLAVIEIAGNRFYGWIELRKLDVNTPKTWFFDSIDKLVVFIQESKTPLAVKEWGHRGRGTTVVKVEEWDDKLLPCLRRFDMEYPAIVQEWLPHSPKKDYMRVINVGGTAMGCVPNEVSEPITHGQEAISYKKRRVPKSIEAMTTKILEFFGAGYASFDIVKSRREYYVVDMHFNHTDLFDQFQLTPRRFTNAWIKILEGVK